MQKALARKLPLAQGHKGDEIEMNELHPAYRRVKTVKINGKNA